MTRRLHNFPGESRDATHLRPGREPANCPGDKSLSPGFQLQNHLSFPAWIRSKINLFHTWNRSTWDVFSLSVRRISSDALASLRCRAISLQMHSPAGINRSYSKTPLNYLGDSGRFKLKIQNPMKDTTRFSLWHPKHVNVFQWIHFFNLSLAYLVVEEGERLRSSTS